MNRHSLVGAVIGSFYFFKQPQGLGNSYLLPDLRAGLLFAFRLKLDDGPGLALFEPVFLGASGLPFLGGCLGFAFFSSSLDESSSKL
jgi:hypothetical protein